MVSFPAELLLGLYFGLLVGVIPALGSWAIGFGVTRWTEFEIPRPGALAIAVVLGGGNAGIVLGAETPGLSVPGPTGLAVSAVVIAALGVTAFEYGKQRAETIEKEGGAMPDQTERNQDVAERDDPAEQQEEGLSRTVQVTGAIGEIAGHPPLPATQRRRLEAATYTVPGDLPPTEQESHLASRLRTEFGLAAVEVTVNEQDEASVAATPRFSQLSNQLAETDKHAVSVQGLIPTGVSAGDSVTVITPNAQVRGTVLGAWTAEDERAEVTDLKTTLGGEGRLTVAVTRTDVEPLVRAPAVKIVVESRESPAAHKAVSQIRQGDNELARTKLTQASPLAGKTIGSIAVDEQTDLTVLGLRGETDWAFPPSGERQLSPGDELFLAGPENPLQAMEGTQ